MTQIKPLPINPLGTKEMKGEKKEETREIDLTFMNIFQSHGKRTTFNIEDLLKQKLKEGAVLNPKINGLLGKHTEKTMDEIKKITGKSIHQILSDKTVSSEVKALSLIAASLQLKGKVQTESENKGTTQSLKKIELLLKETINTNNIAHQKELFKRLTSVLSNDVRTESNIEDQSKRILNFSNKETGRLIANKPSLTKVISEGQSYGEFKLDRGITPTINLNSADTPQQSQHKFMNQLESILKSTRFSHIAKNQTQMTIQLRPDNLGFMTIKVEQVNQELVARIITSTAATKELIESNLHQLRHLNIQVDKFEVNTQQSNQFAQEQDQANQEEQANQEHQQDENEQPSQSFEEQLANILP
ncbi:flagellar hook-length control protein FliK (plasmid) [Rossellomorea sp. AcN35-11]|nr:flagellar hook-length control protein FliK [Rossellomorea aquimaris]WJV32285.1 flagellar hook-length control protein FliK [Rossellomorea sp. AcN35-11]